MNEIKNRIITISGEARSGKSTLADELEKQYKALGFRVHRVEVGIEFRKRCKQKYLEMYPDRVDANQADIQADETFAEKRKEIDRELDEWIRQLGEDINSEERPNDVYIIDSRLAWYHIPSSYAVYLTVDKHVAGQRALEDKSKGANDSYNDIAVATQKTEKRTSNDIKTYEELYGVNLLNYDNYKLIVDTTYSNPEELAGIVIDGLNAYREGTYYPKTWASPAYFIGTQHSRQTCASSGDSGCTPEELAEIMKMDGYNPLKGQITVVEKDGQKFIKNGHHRAVAQLIIGRTLTPYKFSIDPEANKKLEGDMNNLEWAYEWADCIRYFGWSIGKQKQFENFSIENLTTYESRIKPIIDTPNEEPKTKKEDVSSIDETKTLSIGEQMKNALLKKDMETYFKLLKELDHPSGGEGR